jgi:hypothetical protein
MLPHVELLQFGSDSRGVEPSATAIETLRLRWGGLLEKDPYYGREFVDDDFTLRRFCRRGRFRDHLDPLSYLYRVRRVYAAGGLALVGRRAYLKLRRLFRRPPGAPSS